jgi:hypothetical protein
MRRLAKIRGFAILAEVLASGGAFALIEPGEVIVLAGNSGESRNLIAGFWIGKADPSKVNSIVRLTANSWLELIQGSADE